MEKKELEEREYYDFDQIAYIDQDVILCSQDQIKGILYQAMMLIPAEVIDDLFDDCKIVIGCTEEKGTYFPRARIGNKDLIVFPESIKDWNKEEATRIILHEIAHFILKTNDPRLTDMDIAQYEKQENETNELVERWQLSSK